MSHGQAASLEILLQYLGQFEQAQRIGNRGAVLANVLCHILLPQVKLGLQTLIGPRLVQRVEIFALQVLQQRQSQHFFITGAPDQGWDGLQTGHLRCSPTALPGDQFEAAADGARQWVARAPGPSGNSPVPAAAPYQNVVAVDRDWGALVIPAVAAVQPRQPPLSLQGGLVVLYRVLRVPCVNTSWVKRR